MNITLKHIALIILSIVLIIVGLFGIFSRADENRQAEIEENVDLLLSEWLGENKEFNETYHHLLSTINASADIVSGDDPEQVAKVAKDLRDDVLELRRTMTDRPEHYYFRLLDQYLIKVEALAKAIEDSTTDPSVTFGEEETIFEHYLITIEALQFAGTILNQLDINLEG